MFRHTFILSLISCFLIFTGGCSVNDPEPKALVKPGDPFPAFDITLNDGRTINTADLQQTALVIEFFETSCGACRASLPVLNEFYETVKHLPRIQVAAISREENEATVKKFWEANALSVPYSAQSDRKIYNKFATSGIPRVYVCRNGIVVAAYGPDDSPTVEDLLLASGTNDELNLLTQ